MEQNDLLNKKDQTPSGNAADLQAKKPIEIRSIDKVTDFRHLNLFEIKYSDRRGRQRVWRLASRNTQPKFVTGHFDRPDAVVIVAHHIEQNKLVIIKEFRVILGGYQYGFPAGLVDPGETVEATAGRELFEETGLTITKFTNIGPPIYSSSGITDESMSMVYAQCKGTPSRLANESSEDIYTLLVSPEEAADLLKDENLKFDVKTWIVLSEYVRTGKIL